MRPGIEAWIRRAADLGLRSVVATNDDTGRSATHLERLGLDVLIDQVIIAQGIRRKPAPDLYLAALDHLGITPDAAVAVEDSPHGVQAAAAAGVRVIAVPNTVSEHLDLSGTDRIVTDPLAVVLDELLAKPVPGR